MRDLNNRVVTSIPAGYLGNIDSYMDPNTELGRAFYAKRARIFADLGGEETLSEIMKEAVQDFCLFSSMTGGIAARMAKREAVDWGAWIGMQRLKDSLGKRIGMAKRARPSTSLSDVMRGQSPVERRGLGVA